MLSDGLKDRTSAVRDACGGLLRTWLQQAGSPVQFLRAIDVENMDEEKCEIIARELIRTNGS